MNTIEMQVSNGMDSVIRVLSMLRRKKFEIADMSMHASVDQQLNLMITIREVPKHGLKQAMLQINKLEDVYNIKEGVING